MGRSIAKRVFSKIKEIFINPRSSKYINKICSISNKHWERNRHVLKRRRAHRYSRSESPSYLSVGYFEEDFSDDSGIILTTKVEGPCLPPRKVINTTTAVIEPKPSKKLWTTSCGSSIVESEEYFSSMAPKPPIGDNEENNNNYTDTEVLKDSIQILKAELEKNKMTINTDRFYNLEDTNGVNTTMEKNNFVRSSDPKFVVNIFESRRSGRAKRNGVPVENIYEKIPCHEDDANEVNHNKPAVCGNEKHSASDTMYYKLKKLRDVECVKMKEASNALRAIKASRKSDVSEELLAEKILLETDLKYKLIVNKMRDVNYSNVKSTSKHSASITLSNFRYELIPECYQQKSKHSTFFILAVSNGLDLWMSKIVSATEGELVFNEQFFIDDLNENFNIDVKVYAIKLRTIKSKKSSLLLRKKSNACCPMFTIYYENVNTLEMQESSVLNSSFFCCGEFTITKDQITGSSRYITQLPVGSYLTSNVHVIVNANLKLNSRIFGFLTLGRLSEKKDEFFWERKWCCLENNILKVYNYPQDQEYDKPAAFIINLEYSLLPLVKNPVNFSRKRTFILKTGRPSTLNDSYSTTLRKRNNFVLEKFFFTADTKKDFEEWTTEMDSVLESLKDWEKLVLVDDYYL